jgi:hypothetical protein
MAAGNTAKIVRVTKALKAETIKRNRVIAALAARGTDWLLDEIERTQDIISPTQTGWHSIEVRRQRGASDNGCGWVTGPGYYGAAKTRSDKTAQGSIFASRQEALASLLFTMRSQAKRIGIKIPRRRNA